MRLTDRINDAVDRADYWLATNRFAARVWPVTVKSRALVALGSIFVILGYLYMPTADPDDFDIAYSLRSIDDIIPIQVFAWAFVLSGLLAIVSGLTRFAKKQAFMLLSGMTSCWGAVWLIESSLVLDDAPRGKINALLFAVFTVYIWSTADGNGGRR